MLSAPTRRDAGRAPGRALPTEQPRTAASHFRRMSYPLGNRPGGDPEAAQSAKCTDQFGADASRAWTPEDGRRPATPALRAARRDTPPATAGSRRIASGVPQPIVRPKSRTTIRSQTSITNPHVVLDQEHADAPLVGQPTDEPVELRTLGVAETGGGFVEQQGSTVAVATARLIPTRRRRPNCEDRWTCPGARSSCEPEPSDRWPPPRSAAADRPANTSPVSPEEPVAPVGRGAEVLINTVRSSNSSSD